MNNIKLVSYRCFQIKGLIFRMAKLKGNRLTAPNSRWKRKFEQTKKVRIG